MISDKDKYLKIFKLEIENLIEDVSGLIRYETERREKREHSEYVCLENLVVFKDEIMGLNGILGEIDKQSPKFDNTNYVEDLTKTIEDFVIKRGYPQAIIRLIKGKIEKIEEIRGIL